MWRGGMLRECWKADAQDFLRRFAVVKKGSRLYNTAKEYYAPAAPATPSTAASASHES